MAIKTVFLSMTPPPSSVRVVCKQCQAAADRTIPSLSGGDFKGLCAFVFGKTL